MGTAGGGVIDLDRVLARFLGSGAMTSSSGSSHRFSKRRRILALSSSSSEESNLDMSDECH